MIDDARRLKRGLKDVSPLFDSEIKRETRVVLKTAQPAQSIGIFCPEDPAQNLSLNAALASKMQAMGGECALISIKDEKKSVSPKPIHGEMQGLSLKRFSLTLDQFEEACRHESKGAENFGSSVFFLEFDYANPIHFKKVIPMLDKWVFFLKPQLESLSEAFKFMKASLALNHNIEYFVAYYGEENPQKAATFYERFSEIVSRRIGVGINWLGSYDSRNPSSLKGISLETLQLNLGLDSVEKRGLAGFVYPNLRLRG